jgi:hypothetical protein
VPYKKGFMQASRRREVPYKKGFMQASQIKSNPANFSLAINNETLIFGDLLRQSMASIAVLVKTTSSHCILDLSDQRIRS